MKIVFIRGRSEPRHRSQISREERQALLRMHRMPVQGHTRAEIPQRRAMLPSEKYRAPVHKYPSAYELAPDTVTES